jgi:putative DNA primase/helicase
MPPARQEFKRPEALPVVPDHIPDLLKESDCWLVWRYVEDRDPETGEVDWDKPPLCASNLRPGSSTNRRTWSSFGDAVEAYRRHGLDGIGFALSPPGGDGERIVGVDLDHCRQPETGAIAPWAAEIVAKLNTYAEVSPSGTGLRLFLLGRLPREGRKRGDYENYETGRYVTVTGRRVEGTPPTIERRQAEIEAVHRQVWPPAPKNEGRPAPGYVADLADAELVEKARRMKNGAGEKFSRLFFEGDASGYNSRSEAELALCNYLAFFCGPNPERIADLFSQSALMRSKWNREDYRRRTIEKALAGRTNFYRPRGPRARARPSGDGTGADNAGPATPAGGGDRRHLTDKGNGQRLVDDHGAVLRYCHPWRKWLCWDGRRWRPDDTGEIQRRAKDTIDGLFRWAEAQVAGVRRQLQEGASEDEGSRLKALLAQAMRVMHWCLKSEATPRINAMLESARSEPGIPILPDDMDSDHWLLNCPNGTLDLRTGRLRAHRQEDGITKLCPTEYRPDAPCPTWERFISKVFNGDAELVLFVQRLLGLFLTGDVREHALPVWWGNGSNGKTTLATAFLETVGTDYAMKAPADLLLVARGERHPTELADLFGKRLVVASETADGRRFNESLVKDLTGGEHLRARRMREDFWEFSPTHKVVLFTNYRPQVKGTDDGIWRRLQLVPFEVTFWDPDKAQSGPEALRADKALPDKLRAERPGVLRWCVQGCLGWQREGLTSPAKVVQATNDYRAAEDTLQRFIQECCATGAGFRCRACHLYACFRRWCQGGGEEEMSQRRFGDALTAKGLQKSVSNGTWYHGIMLQAEGEDIPD